MPTSGPGAVNGGAANPANMERRGPVEFNHAISYVNKIKVGTHHYSASLHALD
jgi:paired amphipathic helix protein Sin3a